MYCWSLAWRILSITLLACGMSAIVEYTYFEIKAPHDAFRLSTVWSYFNDEAVAVYLFNCGAWLLVSRRSRGEGNGNPLQYSCLENPMGGGAWWAAVHGVTNSQTWLSDFPFTFHFYALEKEMTTHSSVLAWRIPGTGEPGRLPSMRSHRVGHDWRDLAAAAAAGVVGFAVVLVVKNPLLPTQETEETRLRFLDQEDPLEQGLATHFSVLAWIIRWPEEPGGVQCMGLKSQPWLGDCVCTRRSGVWECSCISCFPPLCPWL